MNQLHLFLGEAPPTSLSLLNSTTTSTPEPLPTHSLPLLFLQLVYTYHLVFQPLLVYSTPSISYHLLLLLLLLVGYESNYYCDFLILTAKLSFQIVFLQLAEVGLFPEQDGTLDEINTKNSSHYSGSSEIMLNVLGLIVLTF